MLDFLRARLQQGHQTTRYPEHPVELPSRFRGLPVLDGSRCTAGCARCESSCPTRAVTAKPLGIDLGACLFCPACVQACPSESIRWERDHRVSARSREDLMLRSGQGPRLARPLDDAARRLFGRSLKLRQVSAGGCNGCEAELVALGNVVFDLGRFGVQFVASPRHADGLVVTGPVSRNMGRALVETYEAIPSPRIVMAVGACAISGGPFAGSTECLAAVPTEVPVDLLIPGCPPHPLTLLDGMLRLLGRLPAS